MTTFSKILARRCEYNYISTKASVSVACSLPLGALSSGLRDYDRDASRQAKGIVIERDARMLETSITHTDRLKSELRAFKFV